MAKIRITDLNIRTIIGANDWEREIKQDVLINIDIEFNASKAIKTDQLNDTIDYKTLTKEIIQRVQNSKFVLIEKLADSVLKIILNNKLVQSATVRIDKPLALRFAKSVSVELTRRKK